MQAWFVDVDQSIFWIAVAPHSPISPSSQTFYTMFSVDKTYININIQNYWRNVAHRKFGVLFCIIIISLRCINTKQLKLILLRFFSTFCGVATKCLVDYNGAYNTLYIYDIHCMISCTCLNANINSPICQPYVILKIGYLSTQTFKINGNSSNCSRT